MKIIKKHIAPVLLGIFIFPVVFHPVHIVWHHSNGYGHNYQSIRDDVSNISRKVKHCPICEYKFSIRSLPELSVFKAIITIVKGDLKETAITKLPQQIFVIKFPRAPPSFILT